MLLASHTDIFSESPFYFIIYIIPKEEIPQIKLNYVLSHIGSSFPGHALSHKGLAVGMSLYRSPSFKLQGTLSSPLAALAPGLRNPSLSRRQTAWAVTTVTEVAFLTSPMTILAGHYPYLPVFITKKCIFELGRKTIAS